MPNIHDVSLLSLLKREDTALTYFQCGQEMVKRYQKRLSELPQEEVEELLSAAISMKEKWRVELQETRYEMKLYFHEVMGLRR